MRRSTYAAVVFVSTAIALAGCAALSGLDGITEQACAPDCGDSGTDGTVIGTGPDGTPGFDATPSNDHTMPDDTTTPPPDDVGTGEDAQPSEDASDSATPEASEDAAPDAGKDAEIEDAGVDATPDAGGSDTGCGPLTAIDNCSACGDKCSGADASSSACNGATCSYACKTGFLDCNSSSPPDLDGCECNVTGVSTPPACCSTSCPQPHHYEIETGLVGSTLFYDCFQTGTYTDQAALAACAAYTGSESECDYLDGGGTTQFYCTALSDGGIADLMVCSNGSAKDCACWGYTDTVQGLMMIGPTAGENGCQCPSGTQITWN